MPAAVSICLSVSPEAPFAVIPRALRMETGDTSTPEVPALSSRSRDRAKAVTASPPADRSVLVSSGEGVMSRVSSCELTPQAGSARSSSRVSSRAAARFIIMGCASFQDAFVYIDESRGGKVPLRRENAACPVYYSAGTPSAQRENRAWEECLQMRQAVFAPAIKKCGVKGGGGAWCCKKRMNFKEMQLTQGAKPSIMCVM